MAALSADRKVVKRRNPQRLSLSDKVERSEDFYKAFHWGDEPKRLKRAKFGKAPKVGVKLGKAHAIAYETVKNGERAVWEHEFGEEGGRKPDLVMDVDSEKLHLVGGDYRVRPEGIVD